MAFGIKYRYCGFVLVKYRVENKNNNEKHVLEET